MRALALMALVSGCATTWIGTQATGTQRAWDEHVREVSVPLPGVTERINIGFPIALQAGAPFELTCSTHQRAKDVVYHSAFRYGKRWKLMTGLMALAEGAIATALLWDRDAKPQNWLYGGFLAADATITAALFFIPRKEIYATEERSVVTPVRADCPEGTVLSIGTERYPIDAAGRIGDVAEAALDAWMKEPVGPLQLEVAGQVQRVELGAPEQCLWRRTHGGDPCYAGLALPTVLTSFEVPVGALSTVALAPDAHQM